MVELWSLSSTKISWCLISAHPQVPPRFIHTLQKGKKEDLESSEVSPTLDLRKTMECVLWELFLDMRRLTESGFSSLEAGA